MQEKHFNLNADDFGMSKENNLAVLKGYEKGLLTSASLTANGDFFSDAVENIIPKCPNLALGVHLNIIEGKALTDFKIDKGFVSILINSYCGDFMRAVENEFRAQIELAKSKANITRLDSHVHTHAIPKIFDLVCKLAIEYNIPYVRTQWEKPYFAKEQDLKKYAVNLVKVALLNGFTLINKQSIKKYGLKTNDYLIGVSYTSMMSDRTLFEGLKQIKKPSLTEALIHPKMYTDGTIDTHSVEFDLTQNDELIENIKKLGFKIGCKSC